MSETAYGACTKIEEANGWTAFLVDTGGKWPLKLSTKKTEIIEAARAVGGEPAVWAYNEVESEKINEHTGKPYVNRYLEGVSLNGDEGVRAQAEQSLNVSPREAGSALEAGTQRRPLVGGDKDRAITRMACLKAAAETFRNMDSTVDPPLEVMKIAQRYEQWVYRDIAPPPETLRD